LTCCANSIAARASLQALARRLLVRMADAGPVPCDIAESGMGHANMSVQLPPFWPRSMRPSQWVDECRSQSDVRNASLTRSAPSRGWMSRGWPVRWVADGPGVASGTGESARCSRRALPGAGASLIPIIVDCGRPDARRHRYLSVVVNCRTVTAVLLCAMLPNCMVVAVCHATSGGGRRGWLLWARPLGREESWCRSRNDGLVVGLSRSPSTRS
jgi:hypothetical protein